MMQEVSEIANKNFMKVHVLDGVRVVQDIFCEKGIECFIAYENEENTGIVTKKELICAHPNRIIADVMSNAYMTVKENTSLWEVKSIFDLNNDIDVILVKNNEEITGFITRTILDIEFGKHIDLLTGLYKSDYIFFNAFNIIKSGQDLCIIFIDLNNFGRIDKNYGHVYGDIVLKKTGEIIQENIPSNTYLCRYAGDEFAILSTSNIAESKVLAEKIVKAIKTYEFPNNIYISASVGITGCNIHNTEIDNIPNLINRLINIASLSSTKAKHSTNTSVVVKNIDIDAIA